VNSWSDSPFPPVQQLSGLAIDTTLHENGGQCRRVTTLTSHPGWIYKEYRVEPTGAEIERLDQLIHHPRTLGPADLRLVDGNTSWPATRVVHGGRTTGVCLPIAPPEFSRVVTMNSGKRTITLQVDLLALPEADQLRRDIPGQSLAARVAVCASLAEVGALLERHGLVYLDWSFANAFWSPVGLVAYVIDVDGCSFGARPQIQSHNWDDPLVPQHTLADNCVDRYRVALLVARCLTAQRGQGVVDHVRRLGDVDPALTAVRDLLLTALTASRTEDRPAVSRLSAAFAGVATGLSGDSGPLPLTPDSSKTKGAGVKGWRTIDRTKSGTTQPVPGRRPAGTGPRRRLPTTPVNPTTTSSTPVNRTPTIPLGATGQVTGSGTVGRPFPPPPVQSSNGLTVAQAFIVFVCALALLLFVLFFIL